MKGKSIGHKQLRQLGYTLFSSIGVSKSIYQVVVDGLVDTSLRGVDSHGVRLIPHYLRAAILGRINKNPNITFTKTATSTGILDADHGYGIKAGVVAMHHALNLAKKNGIGVTIVKNSSHFGAAAIYSLLAAKNNMIGLSFTNVGSLVLPYGGKKPFLGTNPICLAAPVLGEDPFCLDMATSQVPWNKILLYRSANKKLEQGWAADSRGKPTLDPNNVCSLLPIGGYKGYGLALMVEIFSSILTSMPYGSHITPMYPLNQKRRFLGHFFMAVNISKFEKVYVFKKRLKDLLNELRNIPPVRGFDKVKVAGDPEKAYFRQRIKKGIPISEETLVDILAVSEEIGVQETLKKLL